MDLLRHFKGSLTDFIFQSRCPLCDRTTALVLCPACQRQIRAQRYGRRQPLWQGSLPVFVWGQYGGGLRQAIAALKYNHQPRVAQLLGHWLAQDWLTSPQAKALMARGTRQSRRSVVAVPIPMHADKRRQRGYDQAVLLARQFCQSTGVPLRPRGLVRQRPTTPQFSLSKTDRQTNLAGAFRLGYCLSKRRHTVLLIDDIYTTGATARAAAAALRQAGLPIIGMVAVATTKNMPTDIR